MDFELLYALLVILIIPIVWLGLNVGVTQRREKASKRNKNNKEK